MKNYRLCYVKENKAYFTPLPLRGPGAQIGDDWNDQPYEHNAGPPYGIRTVNAETGKVEFVPSCVIVTWYGPLHEPSHFYLNSPFSVEDINRCSVPWLVSDVDHAESDVVIWAGSSPEGFIDRVIRAGGTAKITFRPESEPLEPVPSIDDLKRILDDKRRARNTKKLDLEDVNKRVDRTKFYLIDLERVADVLARDISTIEREIYELSGKLNELREKERADEATT